MSEIQGFDRAELLFKLQDLLVDTDVEAEDLYPVVDYIEDNFVKKEGSGGTT